MKRTQSVISLDPIDRSKRKDGFSDAFRIALGIDKAFAKDGDQE